MKSSIYAKINRKTLLMSFVSAIFVCATVFSVIVYLRYYVVSSSENLGNAAAFDSKSALERQAESTIMALVENKAIIADEQLSDVSKDVAMLAESATELLANPDAYGRREILFPDPANRGHYSVQFQHAADVSPESLDDELSLMGNVSELMLKILNNNEDLYSSFLGTETGMFFTVDQEADVTRIFDPRTRPWYVEAKEGGKTIWTEVYEDAMGRGLEITCAAPYYGPDGKMRGVVAVSMHLESLSKIVNGAKLGESGYAFMLGDDGRFLIESENPNIREAAKIMLGGGHGIERFRTEDGDFFLAYYGLKTLPWSLGSVLSVDEAIRPALESEREIIELKKKITNDIDHVIMWMAFLLALAFALAVLLNITLTKRLAKELARPIAELAGGARIIGAGNLNHKLSVETGDEIEVLADTFNTMIADIKKITSEKERIGAELNVARQIQASMLPCIFPAFPQRTEFDIYASMLPAKEVGGDFYDFFFIDDDTLAVVIADVSGKGVPAALFMVITKTLIKNNANLGKSPSEVFAAVNDLLCENNNAGMFVTAFMGYLNTKTGKLTYVNAGHNPPIIGRNGAYEYMFAPANIILAAFEGESFEAAETTLNAGDSLLLYTDGIIEVFNENGKMFGEQRLLDIVNRSAGLELKEALVSIKNEIDLFAGNAEQADDITMLALKYLEA